MGRRFHAGGSLNNENMLYDDSAFQLFFVSLLAVYWIPTVLLRLTRLVRHRWRSTARVIDDKARQEVCPCSLCMEKHHESVEAKKKAIKWWDIIFAIVTVVLLIGVVKVYTANLQAEQPFDPFEILEISRDAGKRQISKAYRKLSLKYHPDKNPGDDAASERFVRLTKAHAALTDPTARKNYKKYGNPDGYQGTTLGIALPAWVEENHLLIMVVYFALFCVVFPVVVGMWWLRQRKMLTQHISAETFQVFAECLVRMQKFKDYVIAFATATEFDDLYQEKNNDAVRKIIVRLKKEDVFDLKKTKWVKPLETYQAQNLVAMMAYLHRVELPNELKGVVAQMLRRVEPLSTAFADTMGVIGRPDCSKIYPGQRMKGNVARLNLCLKVSQHVIQAMAEKDSPLLQIPHMTPRLARMFTSPRNSHTPVKSVYSFAQLSPEEQRSIASGITDEEWLDIKAFCDRYPRAELEVSEPYIEDVDDSVIRANDQITITAKLTVLRKAGSVYSPHCPHLRASVQKHEIWWAVLSDQKLNCPIDIRRLLPKDARYGDIDRVKSSVSEEELNPSTTIYEMKFSFMAPRPGTYTYEVKTDVDCYVGCEQSKTVTLRVVEAVEPDESQMPKYFDTDDESSSEESDDEDDDDDDDENESEDDHEHDDEDCECEDCDDGGGGVPQFEESDTEL